MSVFGSLFTAVSGLSAQSDSISMISNNIANVSTVGYKRTDASFASVVTSASRNTAYSPGSVRSIQTARISQQGILQQSNSATDIAISGNGFFVVRPDTSTSAEALYTRAGSFTEDSNGILRNASGFYLQGWPVDQNGNLPASQADISSLVPVNLAALNNSAATTSTAALALNLKASETQSAYPIGASFTPDFTRSIKVYDSLGSGHDLAVDFKKMESPTATATGVVDLSTMTGPLSSNGFNATDTFEITVGSVGPTTINFTGDMPSIINQINAITDVNNKPVAYAQLNASGRLTIKARNTGEDVILANTSGSPLGGLGLTEGTSVPPTAATVTGNVNLTGYTAGSTGSLTVQVGAGAPQTVNYTSGDSIATIITALNASGVVNASLDGNNQLVIKGLSDGDLVIGGTPPAGIGISAGTTTATPLAMLAPTTDTPSTEGWWTVDFRTPDGNVISSGAINFSGSGSLNADKDLSGKILTSLTGINWGNGSDPQNIDFDMAGFSQFSGQYNVISSDQNGAELGLRTGVSIDDDGYVVAQFSNGQSSKIYKLAIATFANVNGLTEVTGNVFRQSDTSGEYNLREAGQGSAGTVASGALEASNVDLADEFSKMIVTQRAYSANTKVISTADQMMQELLQLR